MARKLKVFRTPIGFHDAYVAAPSRKAALEAWGADSNLFAAGVAEEVTDARLTRAPLARPGEVVRVSRGTAEEQVRALGKTGKRSREGKPSPRPSPARGRGGRGRRPGRAAVEKAERALELAEKRHRAALARLRAEEQALERRRRELERKQGAERERLRKAVDLARERYRAALAEWAE